MSKNQSTLRSAPIVLAHPGDLMGRGHWRVIYPASVYAQAGLIRPHIDTRIFGDDALAALKPDVVIFNCHISDSHIAHMKRYRKILPDTFIVYEIDDLYSAVPEGNIHHKDIPKDIQQRLKVAMSCADCVVTTTYPLADVWRSFGVKDVRVARNLMPRKIFNSVGEVVKSRPKNIGKPRVGWSGSISHGGDVGVISEVVKETADEVQWVFVHVRPDGVPDEMYEYHRDLTKINDSYFPWMAELNLDVAISPLEINDFNNGKSNLKLLEYGACAYDVITTDIYPYRQTGVDLGAPITLVNNTADEWIAAIRERVASPSRGEELRNWVEKNFIAEDYATETAAFWMRDGKLPFVPNVHNQSEKIWTVRSDKRDEEYLSEAAPGDAVLYQRESLYLPSERQIDSLKSFVGDSVSPLSNDAGLLSLPHSPETPPQIDIPTAAKLDESAREANASLACAGILFPQGPSFYLTPTGTAKFGLPRDDYESFEAAAMDWGLRGRSSGARHAVATNVYMLSTSPSGFANLSQNDKSRLAIRFPQLKQIAEQTPPPPTLAQAKQNIEIEFYNRFYSAPPPMKGDYQDWVRTFDTMLPYDIVGMAAREKQLAYKPKIGICITAYNSDVEYLKEAIISAATQAYSSSYVYVFDDGSTNGVFEKVSEEITKDYDFKNVTIQKSRENLGMSEAYQASLDMAFEDGCEWVFFLDHDDTISSHATFMLAEEINKNPSVKMIYSDNDKLDQSGNRVEPHFKTEFDYELLLGNNYLTHLCAFRYDIAKKISFRKGYEGSQDYDFILQYLEKCGAPEDRTGIVHIPRPLYHWRMHNDSAAADPFQKQEAIDNARKAILSHLSATGQQGMVSPHPSFPMIHRVAFGVPDPLPLVSIIIPSPGDGETLKTCLTTLLTKTTYPNKEIILVDTSYDYSKKFTRGRATKIARNVCSNLKFPNLKILNYANQFNFSEVNNLGVSEAKGEIVCLMNDDIEIIDPNWLNHMVGLALRLGVGAVGINLLYKNGMFQHCGVFRQGGACGHAWIGMNPQQQGYYWHPHLNHESGSVTAACLAIKKSTWDQVGGMDERYPIYFNDVDFGERVYDAGYRNVVCATSFAIHNESVTLGKSTDEKNRKQLNTDGMRLVGDHPNEDRYWNRNTVFGLQHLQQGIHTWPPEKLPWESDSLDRDGVLLINVPPAFAAEEYRNGYRVFQAKMANWAFRIMKPEMPHSGPLDVRMPFNLASSFIKRMRITRIVLGKLEESSPNLLGFLTKLGVPIEYRPENGESICPRLAFMDEKGPCNDAWRNGRDACQSCVNRNGSAFGFVDISGYRNQWDAFLSSDLVSIECDDEYKEKLEEAYKEQETHELVTSTS